MIKSQQTQLLWEVVATIGVVAFFKPREAIKLLLKQLLNMSLRYGLSYERFFSVLLCAYGYICEPEVEGGYADVVNYAKSLIRTAESADYDDVSLDNMVRFTRHMQESGYKLYLVDCLGLPEVYAIYMLASSNCGETRVTVTPYINPEAKTDRFREAFKKETMAEIARDLSAPIFRSPDEVLHSELGRWVEVGVFVNLAKNRLHSVTRLIAESAIQSKKAVVVSDHGYDIYCRENLCYASHTEHEPMLSKIAPMIIVTC